MRILELLSSARWTGPAEPMASVARELVRRGHHVELAIETARDGNLREKLRALDLAVRDDLVLSPKSGPFAYAADLRTLRRASRSFDVVHSNFSHDHGLALLALLGRRRETRLVRTVHSARSLVRGGIQSAVLRAVDGVVAVTDAHARLLAERHRVAPERILATRGAVDSEAFRPDGPDLRAELGLAPGQPVAGIVSRLKPGRRVEELIDAFRIVADGLPEARLLLVGRGEGEEDLRARVRERRLEREVIFAGYRTGAELAAAYRTFDVKVLLAEGNDATCRALLEGMASGRPGVAYRFGAPAEAIVDGETGLLVPEGEVPALADALLALLRAPARARAMGSAARERMRRDFTEAARGDAVERFLERIVRLPPVGRGA